MEFTNRSQEAMNCKVRPLSTLSVQTSEISEDNFTVFLDESDDYNSRSNITVYQTTRKLGQSGKELLPIFQSLTVKARAVSKTEATGKVTIHELMVYNIPIVTVLLFVFFLPRPLINTIISTVASLLNEINSIVLRYIIIVVFIMIIASLFPYIASSFQLTEYTRNMKGFMNIFIETTVEVLVAALQSITGIIASIPKMIEISFSFILHLPPFAVKSFTTLLSLIKNTFITTSPPQLDDLTLPFVSSKLGLFVILFYPIFVHLTKSAHISMCDIICSVILARNSLVTISIPSHLSSYEPFTPFFDFLTTLPQWASIAVAIVLMIFALNLTGLRITHAWLSNFLFLASYFVLGTSGITLPSFFHVVPAFLLPLSSTFPRIVRNQLGKKQEKKKAVRDSRILLIHSLCFTLLFTHLFADAKPSSFSLPLPLTLSFGAQQSILVNIPSLFALSAFILFVVDLFITFRRTEGATVLHKALNSSSSILLFISFLLVSLPTAAENPDLPDLQNVGRVVDYFTMTVPVSDRHVPLFSLFLPMSTDPTKDGFSSCFHNLNASQMLLFVLIPIFFLSEQMKNEQHGIAEEKKQESQKMREMLRHYSTTPDQPFEWKEKIGIRTALRIAESYAIQHLLFTIFVVLSLPTATLDKMSLTSPPMASDTSTLLSLILSCSYPPRIVLMCRLFFVVLVLHINLFVVLLPFQAIQQKCTKRMAEGEKKVKETQRRLTSRFTKKPMRNASPDEMGDWNNDVDEEDTRSLFSERTFTNGREHRVSGSVSREEESIVTPANRRGRDSRSPTPPNTVRTVGEMMAMSNANKRRARHTTTGAESYGNYADPSFMRYGI
ncbi:hypothetical protein BLNAU_20683 [Blattamonas nauphoetae]|uniref:Uncharacterized protein n=1 Tax=Blattamonas nauphoetae TaxID=2049346 RepID=A0ABQ9X183_9EUKA|nr:hypothetical protein BLNAU_20683 [Blattamonas nauphoetae]